MRTRSHEIVKRDLRIKRHSLIFETDFNAFTIQHKKRLDLVCHRHNYKSESRKYMEQKGGRRGEKYFTEKVYGLYMDSKLIVMYNESPPPKKKKN